VKLTDSETSGLGTIFSKGQTISYAGLQEFYSNYNDKYNDNFSYFELLAQTLVEICEVLLTVVILGGGILG